MKDADFHERYEFGVTSPPSPRSTGVVFVVVFLIVAALWRNSPIVSASALAIAGLLALAAAFVPKLLGPLNLIWFRFGLLLHRVVNPIVMGVLFALVVVPAGLVMQRFYDPLERWGPRRQRDTYWITRDKPPTADGMRHQF